MPPEAFNRTDIAMQQFLDSLSQNPGSILYRHNIDWRALPPGVANQVLALNSEGLPFWSDAGGYDPAWIDFRSSANYYRRYPVTTSGSNGFTIRADLLANPSTSDQWPIRILRTSPGTHGAATLIIRSSTDANNPNKLLLAVNTSSGTQLARLYSTQAVTDGLPHTLFIDYDGSAGTARLLIDGQDALDTSNPSHVLTTGTLSRGSNAYLGIGAAHDGTRPFNGYLRCLGWDYVSGLDPADFYSETLAPVYIEDDLATPWGGTAPYLWQESAAADQNDGSGGNYTRVGNIRIRNNPL